MTTNKRDVRKGRVFGNEAAYVEEVLASEFRSSEGARMSRRLEEAFADRLGSKYAIAFVNGTATMHAALEAHGVGRGDEVIVPPLTMAATTFAVLQANATPVFADIDPDTFQISAESIAERITPRTRAIVPVALYGLSPDVDAIMGLAESHDLLVIEDAAECFLGRYKGRAVGTIGHCGSFSFQSSKHLTSGEGGMVITDDLGFAERIRQVQSLGYAGVSATKGKISKRDIQDPNYARHVSMGWNYRMPELCAAVALAQLENLDALVGKRIAAARMFAEVADGCDWLVPQCVGADYEHSYWTWAVRLEHPVVSWHDFRDKFVELGGDGIYAAWRLTYLEPMFEKMALLGREDFLSADNRTRYRTGLCPVAERIAPKLLQFRTNYWDLDDARAQADALGSCINQLS